MARALVLGGGGPVGIAWEIGIAAGLAEAGIAIGDAERIIGTSAGAIVGAQLASGRHPSVMYAGIRDRTHAPSQTPAATPDLQPLFEFMFRRRTARASAGMLTELGAYALRTPTMSEADFLAQIATYTGVTTWPDRFVCTAVEAATGAFRAWDAPAGVDLIAAVGSSCAVPGMYPPITLNGLRYLDGGMRSSTNADLARDCTAVLMLAMAVEPVASFMVAAAQQELRDLEASGSRTLLVTPDTECLRAFGPNLMDGSRMGEVVDVAKRQGLDEAERVAALFG